MVSQEIIFQKGVKNDLSEADIQSEFAWFLKNIDFPYDVKEQGQQAFTPRQKNLQFANISFPAGTNCTVGFHYAKEIRKAFAFCHNSNGDHGIYRLNPEDKTVTKVIQHPCLNFQKNPRHYIGEGRVAVFTQLRFNKVTQLHERITVLCFVDDFNHHRQIYVEDCIATNGFTTSFFTSSNPEHNVCSYITLGVPTPLECISVSPIARDMSDVTERNKPNRLSYNAWEFRVKHINVWGEESEHGIISSQYINTVGSSCLGESSGLPRCLNLDIDAGSPIIDKIQVEVRTCSANEAGVTTASDWSLYEVIEKYNNSTNVNWWQRSINPLLSYTALTNTIHYTFCGDKQCTPIPRTETDRLENHIPITSSGLFSLANILCVARPTRKFNKVDQAQLEKVVFSVEEPAGDSACSASALRTITIWAAIYNGNESRTVPIRKKDGKNVFGIADFAKNNPFAYNQVFPDNQEGFIGYLAGTKNYCVSTQWVYDRPTQKFTEVGLSGKLPDANPFAGYMYLQKFELKALPGKYIFRIASHNAKPTDDYQKTSTYYIGQADLASGLGIPFTQSRELVVNVCDSDYTLVNTPIIICDLTKSGKSSLTSASKVTAGYIYEDQKNKIPIERAKVTPNQNFSVAPLKTNETDYNGFYFVWSATRGLQTSIYGIKNCVANTFLAKSRTALDQADLWFRQDELFAYTNPLEYLQKDRYYIGGRVVLSDTPTIGVPGVLVVYTKGGYTYTDTDGNFKLLAHNRGDGTNRVDDIIYGQRGGCQIMMPDTPCNYCLPQVTVSAPACGPTNNITSVSNVGVRIRGNNMKGPTQGARYNLGFALSDGIRETRVQRLSSHVVDIPGIQKTGVYEYSKIKFNIDSSFNVSPEFIKLNFYITDNLNEQGGPFTWVAERVQFIDNSGNVNTSAPTQIRLYYQSLNEYNKQNNFSTNTAWQFLTEDEHSVVGDQVEFLINGDGVIFTKRITALVKYDATGKFIQIDYNDALKDLKDGALIKLIRPRQCESEEFYYQIGCSLRLTNGLIETTVGYLPVVDSYMQTRQIPVPVEVKKSGTDNAGHIIETSTQETQIRNYSFFFEHHSPSDFWGDHCHGRGRVNVVDKYERRVVNRMEIALAKKLKEGSSFNGLSYFTEDDVISFPDQEWSGINVVIVDQNTLLVICEKDNFVVGYDDNTVRIDSEGNAVAYSAENKFGKPQRKKGNKYGCNLDDVNTIREKNGKVVFLDTDRSELLIHNYSECVNVADGYFSNWLIKKIRHVQAWNIANPLNKKYFHSGISPKNEDYFLSVCEMNHPSGAHVNALLAENISVAETIVYNIRNFVYKGHVSFVPEYYGFADADIEDLQLYTFVSGQPWYHYRRSGVASTDYCNFYGVSCSPVIQVVGNLGKTKKKVFLGTEVYSKHHVLYASLVETDVSQVSRIMPLWWQRADNFWMADFKCDINTPIDSNLPDATGANALLDGEQLRGSWIKVRFIPKAADINRYFELTAIKIGMIGQEKSG